MARASHVLAAKIYVGSNAEIMEKVFPIREILFCFFMISQSALAKPKGEGRFIVVSLVAIIYTPQFNLR